MYLQLPRLPRTPFHPCRIMATWLAVIFYLGGIKIHAAPLIWTGLSVLTNSWSDPNNWSPAQVPTASDSVTFTNSGSTNVIGATNNTVNANITISNLLYSAVSNSIAVNTHTTLINPGVTLTANSTVTSATTNAYVLLVGGDNVGSIDLFYATILGLGTLAVGNLASPNTNLDITISARALTANSGAHKGMLDMAGLNNFTFGGGRFQVSGNGVSPLVAGAQYTNIDRALGSVLLAKTNVITAARPKTDQFPLAISPFAVAVNRYANASGNLTLVELGQENTINTEAITIGGARASTGGTMRFRAGSINPTIKLRNADGISRMAEIGIGDNDIPNSATVASVGTMDFSLGTVDILVDKMIVGSGNGYNNLTAANGTGTLTLGAGICDVTTLNIGCQRFNNNSRAIGTVNVRTNATLVAGNINMGFDAGDVSTAGNGTLTINGGQVRVSGNLGDNSPPGFRGTNTLTINAGGSLDMMPAGDTVPGDITVTTLNIGLGTLTNYGTLSASFINQTTPVTDFIVYPGQALAPVARGVIGTLAVKTNLTLNSAILRFDLDSPVNLNDQISVTNILTLNGVNTVEVSAASGTIASGTYTLMTYGTLVGGTNNLQMSGALANSRYTFAFDATTAPNINLTVSGSTSNLIWFGGGGNLWNYNSAASWNNGTEKFYSLDAVTFDDTSTNRTVNISGAVAPASVTVASDNNYSFSGSGNITGSTVLTKSGLGTLTLSNPNSFVGAVSVNAGRLMVNGGLGISPVSVKNGATLAGTGTLLGPVTVENGGTFSPGASIGTITISNNLVLADGSTTAIEANLDTTYDKVIGLNKVTYGGTLNLSLSGRPLVAGDALKLFSATTVANPTANYSPYVGAFTSIVPSSPGTDLAWNTNTLTSDGTLRVVSLIPPTMTAQFSNNQLDITWPAGNIGWRLQSQINPITVGISNNWVNVAGTLTTNHVTITPNPTNGTAFYRLIYFQP